MDGTAFLPVPWKKLVVPSGTTCGIVLDQRSVDRRSLRSGTNLWARNIHCTTVNGMSGTRPYLAVQGETGIAQQNHPNRFLRLLPGAYADTFSGSTSVAPACSGPLLKKLLPLIKLLIIIPVYQTKNALMPGKTHLHALEPLNTPDN